MQKNTFKYHKVSEEEKQEIKKNAKKLLDKFATKLEKIKTKQGHFKSSVSETGLRQENTGWNTDNDFHDITLLNAPFVQDDFIIAEKGGWKK